MHVFLNCPTGEAYGTHKHRGPIDTISASYAGQLLRTGEGPATMFAHVLDYLADPGGGECISDLAVRIDGA